MKENYKGGEESVTEGRECARGVRIRREKRGEREEEREERRERIGERREEREKRREGREERTWREVGTWRYFPQ
eukprot:1324051-Amorphochlora_amoeboformis.AAC.1